MLATTKLPASRAAVLLFQSALDTLSMLLGKGRGHTQGGADKEGLFVFFHHGKGQQQETGNKSREDAGPDRYCPRWMYSKTHH